MPWRIRAAAWALLLLVSQSWAQGTITDPPATFERPVSAFDSSPVARLTGVSANPTYDHVYTAGWWYRLAGDTKEDFLPTPNAQSYVNDTSVLTWNDVNGRGFRAVETAVVTNGGGPSGRVVFTLSITNLSESAALSIDLFHMADLEGGSSLATETATLLVPNELIGVAEASDTAQYGALGAAAFLVLVGRNSSGLPDVADRLSDAVVDNFDNSGLPFGPEDVSAGFQWATTVIPPSGSATFVAGIAVNMALTLPAESSTTTSSTLLGASTTSTTLSTEICHNCIDDNGNGLVDESPECCGEEGSGGFRLLAGSLRPVAGGLAAVKLKARIPEQPALSGGVSPTEDVMIRLNRSESNIDAPNSTDLVCAHFPAASFLRRRGKVIFRDPDHTLPSAKGFDTLILARRRNGSLKLILRGERASLTVPPPGWIGIGLALRDPATTEYSRCVGIAGAFRATRKGLRFPP